MGHAISTRESKVRLGTSLNLNPLGTAKQHEICPFLDGLRVQFQNVLTALSLAINLARL
jgi:hypothetical protein